MVALIDILRQDAGSFVVDIEAAEVPINPFATNYFQLPPPSSLRTLQPNDNVIIQSCWIVFPYCFCAGSESPYLALNGQETAAPFTTFQVPFSSSAEQWIPVENVETGIGQYIPWTSNPLATPWGFMGTVTGTVSMFNVPPILDEYELQIYAYLKIEHTLPLLA